MSTTTTTRKGKLRVIQIMGKLKTHPLPLEELTRRKFEWIQTFISNQSNNFSNNFNNAILPFNDNSYYTPL